MTFYSKDECSALAEIAPIAKHDKDKSLRKTAIDNLKKMSQTRSHFFPDSILLEPPTLYPSSSSHPQKTQTVGTARAATAKSPKADFLQKHSNLVCSANLGVNNTILVFN